MYFKWLISIGELNFQPRFLINAFSKVDLKSRKVSYIFERH